MALKISTKAPDFTLASTAGNTFTLSKLEGSPCILYFYPKDFTAVCTKEACEFRDQFEVFKEVNIPVVGISRDAIKTHMKFKSAHQLPFELLSDPSGEVAKKYDALIPIVGLTKRITYLLNKDHVITAVYNNLFNFENHVKKMVEKITKDQNTNKMV